MIAASSVLSITSAAQLPVSLAQTLIGLGTASNELSFALAETRLREHHATLAVVRVSEREDDPNQIAPEYSMIGQCRVARGNLTPRPPQIRT
jgi:hypothetical protein